MIKLFISDIDGCISEPFTTPDWELLSELRALNIRSKTDEAVPPLTICSGRPRPYVEAVSQWLDIDLPVVFESAGLYRVAENRMSISPEFDEEAKKQIGELKEWISREVIPDYEGMELEFTKLMDAGLLHLDREVIQEAYSRVVEKVAEAYPRFEIHKTDISINIILKENNKRNGIQMICSELVLQPSEVAYIGDSSGDIPGLSIVGFPYAPQNATDEVKEVAEEIPLESTEAVLAAYRKCIEYNRRLAEVDARG